VIFVRLRNVKNADLIINSCDYVIKNPETFKGNFKSIFNNDREIHIEIGMGKGKFLYEMAQNSPDINYIGIEKYESVLVRAVEKINLNPLENLRVMCVDAKSLGEIFDHEISCIYLNFSDPWPKNRHANRRLTSKIFLDIYENLFKDKKMIIQKTDNITLFASSIKNLNNYGYYFEEVSMDLENTNIPNIETEYENKFKNKGFKINYVKAIKK
jgi:tRNA (guanine-N7-)-methyltransferase